MPSHGNLQEVDARWNRLCKLNPAYFDGRIWHVLGVHRNGHGGAVLHVVDCAYRFFAVQSDSYDLGVRSLGVKGLVQDDEGRLLMGKRTATVAHCKSMWEFAPSGGVEPGRTFGQSLCDELREETGLSAISEPLPIAVAFDPHCQTWEIICRLQVAGRQPIPNPEEYELIEWRPPTDFPRPLSPIAEVMTGLLSRCAPD